MNFLVFVEEFFVLTEYEANFSRKKLDEVKSNYKKRIGNLESKEDYFNLFHDFPLVQSVIRILFNYQVMVNEFENGSNPFYGTTTELKKHPKNLETTLKQFRGALEVSMKLSDAETVYRLKRTINHFELFLESPSDFLNKLHFFEIMNGAIPDKDNSTIPLVLHYNPFNDSLIDKWSDCSYYLEMLKFFDGFDVTLEALAKSTYIKLHKIFELNNPQVYMQENNPLEALKSIFEKIGREGQSIDLKRLKNVQPKTFYKGIAVFDYSHSTDFLFNRYFEHAMQNATKDAIIHDKINKIKIDFETKIGIDPSLKDSLQKIYRDLLSF